MSNWKPLFAQGGEGDPRRCFNSDGEEVHVIVFERIGRDLELGDTRRVVGMGARRPLARADAMRAIGRYDSSPTILRARKTRV